MDFKRSIHVVVDMTDQEVKCQRFIGHKLRSEPEARWLMSSENQLDLQMLLRVFDSPSVLLNIRGFA